jgi:hypothetical protein
MLGLLGLGGSGGILGSVGNIVGGLFGGGSAKTPPPSPPPPPQPKEDGIKKYIPYILTASMMVVLGLLFMNKR